MNELLNIEPPINNSNVLIYKKTGEIEIATYIDGYFHIGNTGLKWCLIRDLKSWEYIEDEV